MKTKIILILNVLLLCGTLLVAADVVATPGNPFAFKATTAIEAMRNYYADDKVAWRAYCDAEIKHRGKLIEALTAVQDQLAKANQLEEALKVKNAIASLRKEQPPIPDAATTQPAVPAIGLVGKWIRSGGPNTFDVILAADGTCARKRMNDKDAKEISGTWQVQQGSLKLNWPDKTDTFELRGNPTSVELLNGKTENDFPLTLKRNRK